MNALKRILLISCFAILVVFGPRLFFYLAEHFGFYLILFATIAFLLLFTGVIVWQVYLQIRK